MKKLVVAGMLGLAACTGLSGTAVSGPLFGAGGSFGTINSQQVPIVRVQANEAYKVQQLEEQIRQLNGRIEEMSFQLLQMQETIRKAQEDNEFRFQDLEGGKGSAGKRAKAGAGSEEPAAAATAEEPSPPAQAAEPPPAEKLSDGPPLATGQAEGEGAVLGEPPKSIGTLIIDEPPASGQPIDLSAIGKGEAPAAPGQIASLQASGDPGTDFKAAYEQTVKGDYDLAEAGFRQFLANYPNDPRAAEAQYWIGDSLFSRGKYGEAAAEFRVAYKKYPQSTKGAETLLKIGMSATATEDFASACKIYAQLLKQYPQASNALRQRVKVEQASAGC